VGTAEILRDVRCLAEDLFSKRGFILVDMVLRKDRTGFALNVLADKPHGGISIEDCGALNRVLRQSLEERDFVSGDFTLDVSSPGLDRPLKSKDDFIRFQGRRAVVFLSEAVGGRLEWSGVVGAVSDYAVTIGDNEVPFVKINKAKPVL